MQKEKQKEKQKKIDDLTPNIAKENAKRIAKRLYDIGAKKVELLNMCKKNEEFQFMILASGTTQTTVKLLASETIKFANQQNIKLYKIEGEFKAEWIVLDFYDFVAHILMDSARAKYNLDKLWKTSKNQIKFNS